MDKEEELRVIALRIAIDILRTHDGSIHANPEEVIGIADKVSRFITNTKEVK